MKETREGVVSDKERYRGIHDNVSYVNNVMDRKIVVNLVSLNQFFRKFPEICCFLRILTLTPQECSQHLLYLIQAHLMLVIAILEVRVYVQTYLSLDKHDEYMLNILKELQCPGDQRIVEECTEQCRLTGNFVLDIVIKWFLVIQK